MEAGEIRDWAYESIKLKVGEKICWYAPDFAVVAKDWTLEFHEYKGFWKDDARVKIKAAASQYPGFRFVAVTKKKGGGYEYEEIG